MALKIITGSGPDVQTLVQSPNFIRSQEEYEFTVTIINNEIPMHWITS